MTKTVSESDTFILPDDWRGKMMTQIRRLIKATDPAITEMVKYRTASNPNGVLVWYKNGMISTGEIYKKHLRIALAKGNLLKTHDPKGLINTYRAIIIQEKDILDEEAFKNLIRAAVELNDKGK